MCIPQILKYTYQQNSVNQQFNLGNSRISVKLAKRGNHFCEISKNLERYIEDSCARRRFARCLKNLRLTKCCRRSPHALQNASNTPKGSFSRLGPSLVDFSVPIWSCIKIRGLDRESNPNKKDSLCTFGAILNRFSAFRVP